jgi:hypothetical protein
LFLLVVWQAPSPPSTARDVATKLEALAAHVAQSLAQPVPIRTEDRGPQLTRFVRDLELARTWPHARFRAPLLTLLEEGEPLVVVSAADALLNYGDDTVRARIAGLRHDPRRYAVGCLSMTVGASVSALLQRERPGRMVPLTAGLFPHDVDAPGHPATDLSQVTLPQALESLGDDNLSIRLQAFSRLSLHGLFPDVSPLREAWPRMRNEERCEALTLAQMTDPRLGAAEFGSLIAGLFERRAQDAPSECVLDRLLDGLAMTRSPATRAAALAIIEERLPRAAALAECDEDTLEWDPLAHALGAFASVATADDVKVALQWTESDTRMVRLGGITVLASIEAPEAFPVVAAYLAAPEDLVPDPVDPFRALRVRHWGQSHEKWRYLRRLVELLNGELAALTALETENAGYPEGVPAARIISTLEAIAGTQNGGTGARHLGPLIRTSEAKKTLQRWERWVEENEPRARR